MKLAALDIGLKRIGIAVSLPGGIVVPQPAVLRKNRNQAARDVKAFLQEHGIEKVVVGIPLGGSSEEEMRRRIEHFVGLMQLDIPVVYQDESGSSEEAKALMQGHMRQKRDGRIDSLAAKIILERYLEAQMRP
jgi:putative Holliday junction resolvase